MRRLLHSMLLSGLLLGFVVGSALALDTPSLTISGSTSNSISLSWTNAGDEESYIVSRSTDGSSYVDLATPGADVTSYTDSGLNEASTYYYIIRAVKSGLPTTSSPPQSTNTSLQPPSGLSKAAATDNTIDLAWQIPAGSTATNIVIERNGSVIVNNLPGTTVNYHDTGLNPGNTYTYRIKAVKGSISSEYCSQDMSTSNSTPPAAPANLAANAISATTVRLSWQDNSNNEIGFRIERMTSGGSFTPVGTVNSGITSYDDTSTVGSTNYIYRVLSFNDNGNAASNSIQVTTLSTTAPVAPSSLTAAAASANQINLIWTDNSNNETGFRIERKTSGGSFTDIGTTSANSNTYSDNGLTSGQTYSYRVRSYVNSEYSSYSNEANATTTLTAPNAPTGLNATASSGTQISLYWVDNADNETGFRIERRTSGTNYTEIVQLAANVAGYTDNGLTANTTYYYRVRAYNGAGSSSYTTDISATTTNGGALAAPSNLSVSYSSSNARITLSWRDNSSSETYFYIERKTSSNGNYSVLNTVNANTTSYYDTSISSGYTYYYRIRAYNSSGYSSYSNEDHASASNNGTPNAPDDLSASAYSSSRIDLTWDDNSSNETYFYIERKTGSSGSYSQIASVSSGTESYSDTGLSSGTKYYYRIRAYNSNGYSDYCSEDYATTNSGSGPTAPDDLEAKAYSSSRIDLTWDDRSSDETKFYIERKTGSNGSYSQLATVSSNTQSYSDTNLSASTKYYYRVRAYNSSGYSDYCAEDSATTTGNTGPNAPSSLTAAAANGYIGLKWVDNASNETNYIIERKTPESAYSELTRVAANVTSYNDYSATDNSIYYSYRVRGYNSSGYSDYSNITSIQPLAASKVLRFSMGQKSYYSKGQKLTMDVAPIIRNNRTMLPIRYITDQIGAQTAWDNKTQKVTITYKTKKIEIWVGKRVAKVNAVNKYIDSTDAKVVPVVIPPGRTMLPLRFVSENLGCKVDWDAATNTAIVTIP